MQPKVVVGEDCRKALSKILICIGGVPAFFKASMMHLTQLMYKVWIRPKNVKRATQLRVC